MKPDFDVWIVCTLLQSTIFCLLAATSFFHSQHDSFSRETKHANTSTSNTRPATELRCTQVLQIRVSLNIPTLL